MLARSSSISWDVNADGIHRPSNAWSKDVVSFQAKYQLNSGMYVFDFLRTDGSTKRSYFPKVSALNVDGKIITQEPSDYDIYSVIDSSHLSEDESLAEIGHDHFDFHFVPCDCSRSLDFVDGGFQGFDTLALIRGGAGALNETLKRNDLGFFKLNLQYQSLIFSGIENIETIDGENVDLDTGLWGTTDYKVSTKTSDIWSANDRGNWRRNNIDSQLDDYSNILVVESQKIPRALSEDKADFRDGSDALVVLDDSSSINVSFVDESWWISDAKWAFPVKNLEFIQFSDIAFRLNENGTKDSIEWKSFDNVSISNPSPTPGAMIGSAPKLLTATLRGKQLVLQFEDIISDSLPRLSNFTLNHGNRKINFSDVEVVPSAGQVVLTLPMEIDPTARVTLDYFDLLSDQITNVVQSKSGEDLPSFNGFQVDNQTTQDNLLAIEDGDFEGNTISLNLNSPLSSSVPSSKRFTVRAGRKKQQVTDVATDSAEGIVMLTTKTTIGTYESVKVTYRDLAGDQTQGVIEDQAGNDMKTVRDFEIINGGYEEIPPKLLSAELDENILTVEFDSIINNTKLSRNRFKVKANGKRLRVKSASVDDDNESFVTLSLQVKRNQAIDLQSEVTLSYRDPRGDQMKQVVEDLFGNDLPSFSEYSVDIV